MLFEHYSLKVMRWPDPDRWDSPFEITLHFGWVEGRMECVGLDVRSFQMLPGAGIADMEALVGSTSPEPVTSSVLRSIPLGHLIDEARTEVLRQAEQRREALRKRGPMTLRRIKAEIKRRGYFVYPIERTEMRQWVSEDVRRDEQIWAKEPRRGRPPTYGLQHFEQVARIYREAYAAGRTPTRAVARHFKVSHTAAAKWVGRSRALGLLPATTRGRARAVEPSKTASKTKRKGRKR